MEFDETFCHAVMNLLKDIRNYFILSFVCVVCRH